MVIETTITRRNGEAFKFYVDDCDADLLHARWHVTKDKTCVYVYRNVLTPKRSRPALHRIIMARILGRELTRAELVDHKDRNGLNNTRENLRLATSQQNQGNSRVKKTSKTGVKGVRAHKGKFEAWIRSQGKQMYLGTFNTTREAHDAYVKAAKQVFGEFARGD